MEYKKNVHITQFDGLRGIAVLIVMIWHASLRATRVMPLEQIDSAEVSTFFSFVPHGETGVVLFFSLSGFLISRKLASMPFSFKEIMLFYKGRLNRICPPYFIVMIFAFFVLEVTGHIPNGASSFNAKQIPLIDSLAASLFFLHGTVFGGAPRINPPAWSLEIEVQFYLIAPILLIPISYVQRPSLRLAAFVIILLSIVVVSALILPLQGGETRFRGGILHHAPYFIAGICTALCLEFKPRSFNAFKENLAFLAGATSMLAIGCWLTQTDAHIQSFIIGLLTETALSFASFLILWGCLRAPIAAFFLKTRILVTIGVSSYSIYLTHVIIMQAIGERLRLSLFSGSPIALIIVFNLVLVPVSLVVGRLFYLLVEARYLRKTSSSVQATQ